MSFHMQDPSERIMGTNNTDHVNQHSLISLVKDNTDMDTDQVFSGSRFEVVGKWISVLKGVAASGKESCSIKKILPINPGTSTSHHFVLDPLSDLS